MDSNILTVTDLSQSFGHKRVLTGINFKIERGHVVGLIGANGAGKTTIMKAILGLSRFKGQIELDQQEISLNRHIGLKSVGALIEYPGLYPYLTGRQQLQLFATGPERKVNVDRVIQKLGMQTYADWKTKKYSLGMKQKLGVALALLNQPEFVILDEPMNGLDPEATRALRNLILQEKQSGVTFLISSHILSELQRIADDVVVIDQGKVVTATTMPALLAANQDDYVLQTDQDQLASEVLNATGYQVKLDHGLTVTVTTDFSLNDLLVCLINHGIKVLAIEHQTGDLEESLLNVLTSDQPAGGQQA